MCPGKFLAKLGQLVHNFIIRGSVKPPSHNSEYNTKKVTILNKLNNNS